MITIRPKESSQNPEKKYHKSLSGFTYTHGGRTDPIPPIGNSDRGSKELTINTNGQNTSVKRRSSLALSYDDAVKVLLYHHKGSMWIQNLEINKIERYMEAFTKLVNKSRKALEPFVEYVLGVYYNDLDEYGNQIEESSREESFERRWNRARAILLKRE